MLQILVSGGLVFAGLYVALTAETPASMRPFGWVVAVIGALSLAGAMLLRRGRRP